MTMFGLTYDERCLIHSAYVDKHWRFKKILKMHTNK